jgi:hypothetical protein
MQVLSLHKLQITNEYLTVSHLLSTGTTWSIFALITFHFATLAHAVQPLDLVTTQQFFTSVHNYGHLVVE